MGALKAVVFDLDGTLFDHEAAVVAALRQWLPVYGLAAPEIDSLVPLWLALETRHHLAWRTGEITFAEQRRRRLRDFLPVAGLPVDDDSLDAVFAGYVTRYEANWRAYDDAEAALRAVAAASLRSAVLTNGDHQQQTQKLRAIGLWELCGPVYASSMTGFAKPDARAYRSVCAGLGLEPEEVLMVGDDYALDVLAARSAGLSAVHLDRTGTHSDADQRRIQTLAGLACHGV